MPPKRTHADQKKQPFFVLCACVLCGEKNARAPKRAFFGPRRGPKKNKERTKRSKSWKRAFFVLRSGTLGSEEERTPGIACVLCVRSSCVLCKLSPRRAKNNKERTKNAHRTHKKNKRRAFFAKACVLRSGLGPVRRAVL